MNVSLASSPVSLGLPSFLKPQVRWIPQVAGQAARLGTLALLGYTGYHAYAQSAYSLAEAGLLQNAFLVSSPVIAAWANSNAVENLATRFLWKPIQKEKLRDRDQVLTKAVLESPAAQQAVEKDFPGALGRFNDYLASSKRAALTSGLLLAGVGAYLTYSYLNQFG